MDHVKRRHCLKIPDHDDSFLIPDHDDFRKAKPNKAYFLDLLDLI